MRFLILGTRGLILSVVATGADTRKHEAGEDVPIDIKDLYYRLNRSGPTTSTSGINQTNAAPDPFLTTKESDNTMAE